MIWFFWAFTSAVVVYSIYTAVTADNCSRFLAATRLFRTFILAFIYVMYGCLAISSPDAFDIADNTATRTWLEFLTIINVAMTMCWFGLFIKYRPRSDTEQAQCTSELNRLKWRQAEFDREAFIAEWKNLFRRKRA